MLQNRVDVKTTGP